MKHFKPWLQAVCLISMVVGQARADQEHDYQVLIQETRCRVCHNQNIADVDTPFAQHLRQRIQHSLAAGLSLQEVRDQLRAEYGDAISYRPPQEGLSQGLWLLPGVLLLAWLCGLLLVWTRRQRR